MTTPSQQPNSDGWTLVTRRRRPPHFLPSPTPPPRRTSLLNLRSPTYAQVVRSGTNNPPPKNTQMTAQDKAASYSRLPQSPTNLRYPPNPHFKEWWGRCFRCAKKGHIVAECPLPRPQPRADTQVNLAEHLDPIWAGPTGPASSQTSSRQIPGPNRYRLEPSFEEFLGQPEPKEEPYMPSIRPAKTVCYFNRDEEYNRACQKLATAIVIQPPEILKGKLSLDQVADIIAASNKLTTAQLQVGLIAKDRFLAVLPSEANRDEIVAAIPRKVWEDGFTLQPYSPVVDASISIPFFKVWVDIRVVPLELYTELHMARVISSFGIYLGSIEPQMVGDCQTWSVFLATDDLALIPYQVEIRVGGMVHTAQICPRKWNKGQVFHRSDLPPSPVPYRPPTNSTVLERRQPSPPPVDPRWFQQDEDVVPMSLTALREIFRHFSTDELPADFAACLAGDERAIAANHEAYRQWEANEERRRQARHSQTTQEPIPAATADPVHLALGSSSLQQPTQEPPLSRSHASRIIETTNPLATAAATSPTAEATVRRTEQGAPRGKRVLTDLELQVCTLHSHQGQGHNFISWEPSELFPEICIPHPKGVSPIKPIDKGVSPFESSGKKQKVRSPTPNKSAKPRRSSRIRINKNKKGAEGTIGMEISDFIDIPLQHAEGIELLAAIGAGNVTIPSTLMLSPQHQNSRLEIGQPSKGPSKRKKQFGPMQDPLPPLAQPNEECPNNTHVTQDCEMQAPATRPYEVPETQLEQAEEVIQDVVTNATPDPQTNSAQLSVSEEQEDDRYLDQVDYSDEDLFA